jgi:glycosyltransferase involved in cell wall biosynthesis
MRILMLMQWCRPEPDFKCIPMAKALIRRGHEVEVLTGFPNYPGGKIYAGYRLRCWQREIIEGVPVIRVPLFPSHDKSSFRRACNYGSFALAATLLGPLLARRPDVVYAYNPMGLPALAFKLFRRVPFVYDIQDLWPDSLIASGMMRNRRLLMNLLGRFFQFVYRQAGQLIVLSPGFKAKLVSRGVPGEKIAVIYNWCDEDGLGVAPPDPAPPRPAAPPSPVNILYAGNIGRAQALHVVLDAAKILQPRCPAVRFTIIGSGTELENLRARAEREVLANVQFLARVPPAKIGAVMATADALLVHLRDDPLFRITIPSKTQTYMAMGKPLIAGVAGDTAALIETAGGGLCFQPEDGPGLAAAAEHFWRMDRPQRDELGQRAQAYYQTHLALGVAAERFEKIFLSVSRRVS